MKIIENVSNKKKMALMAVTILIVATLLVMTFVIPDHEGKLREDLVVGDYITLKSDRFQTTYTIKEIDDNKLTVEVDVNGDKSETIMTKEKFLSYVIFDEKQHPGYQTIGMVDYNSPFGHKLCYIYSNDLNSYRVGEYNIIYNSGIGGNFWKLMDTSLMYDSPIIINSMKTDGGANR